MTESTSTTLDTIDAVLADDTEHEVLGDTVDAEVVSDTVEEEDVDQAATAKPKRNRRKAQEGDSEGPEAREVPTPEPTVEKSTFTPAKARAHTDKIKKATANAAELFLEAWDGRIWLAYGDQFSTGKPVADAVAWVKTELGNDVPKLAPAKRKELVVAIKNETKASQSAIAELLGVDQKTVSNDLRDVREEGVEVAEESEGLDGRVTSGNSGSSGRTKPYADRLHAAVEKAFDAVGKITELRAEDEWETEGRVYRSQLTRLVDEVLALRNTLEESEDFSE